MSIVCCGVKYSKNDPNTYWCIETDINSPVQKKYVEKEKVAKEVVDTLVCKKCGAQVVIINRYSKLKNSFKLLEKERLSGKKAKEYLNKTINVRKRQKMSCPIKKVPYAKHIDLCYGKAINDTTQRARYVNDLGWGTKETYSSPITIKKI